jgi:hypothetical protein
MVIVHVPHEESYRLADNLNHPDTVRRTHTHGQIIEYYPVPLAVRASCCCLNVVKAALTALNRSVLRK